MFRWQSNQGRFLTFFVIGAALIAPLSAKPDHWRKAAVQAEELIGKSRRLGGEVFAKKARKLLAPWWKNTNPPQKILLQRATLLQREHHFKEALRDLNLLLKNDPKSTEAWLMKTTILTVMGRFEEARQASIPLFGLAPPLVATTAGTAATASNGNLAASYDLLLQVASKHQDAPSSIRAWSQTALAEMAVRLGKTEQADEHFRTALILDQTSPYLLKTYSYFLLDLNAPHRVLELLKDTKDHLSIPWLLAEKKAHGESPAFQKQLAKYEESHSHTHHGHSHGREEAIYALHLKNNPREAIHQATGNWESQREAADLIILLESAIAAEDEVSLTSAISWIHEKKFEDARLAPLLKAAQKIIAP